MTVTNGPPPQSWGSALWCGRGAGRSRPSRGQSQDPRWGAARVGAWSPGPGPAPSGAPQPFSPSLRLKSFTSALWTCAARSCVWTVCVCVLCVCVCTVCVCTVCVYLRTVWILCVCVCVLCVCVCTVCVYCVCVYLCTVWVLCVCTVCVCVCVCVQCEYCVCTVCVCPQKSLQSRGWWKWRLLLKSKLRFIDIIFVCKLQMVQQAKHKLRWRTRGFMIEDLFSDIGLNKPP